ncbi:hypothetical protein [Vibrio penaeicida]|uniref:hypothetical protein n=1 Tax=Vibrio penaeicida TaxID=104609 RepID=UPI000CE9E60A|nr:hypothetical protein [Vibrio penaeicida]
MEYLNNLIQACERAKQALPIRDFVITHPRDIPTNIKKGIYVIQEVGGDIDDTFQLFIQFKNTKLKSCCKINHPSRVLYVGSSTTGLHKRLRQHLVKCHEKTYSLHLYHWFEGKYEIHIKEYDEDGHIIQLIEDNISHKLKPAFGKQGGNNK